MNGLRAALLLSLLFLSPWALANDSSISFVAGQVRLQPERAIEMVAEKLVFFWKPAHVLPAGIPCPAWIQPLKGFCQLPAHWVADLRYRFKNRGVARTLHIGLPFDMPLEWPNCEPLRDVNGPNACQAIDHFGSWQDGKRLSVRQLQTPRSGAIPFNRVYLSTISLAAGQETELRHQYLSFLQSGIGGQRFRYLLRTGNAWAAPIGQVSIDFQLPPDTGPCALSNLPFQRQGDWLKIRLGPWRPDRDLEIVFAARERVLVGTPLQLWATTPQEICAEARHLDQPVRSALAANIRRLYGDASLITPGHPSAWSFCQHAEYLAPYQDQGVALPFLADPHYPNNLPPALQACLKILAS